MTEPVLPSAGPARSLSAYGQQGSSANLADILERVLDKGIVIVGDIKINLLDIELLTIKLRLLVASVDKAKEIGIDWWEHDPALSSRAGEQRELEEQNERLRAEVRSLRQQAAQSAPRSLPEGRAADDAARPRRTETERSHAPVRSRERETERPRETELAHETERPRTPERPRATGRARGAEPARGRRRPGDDEDRR
ncbi:gas vesicle protein [Streptomyces sichuanensis]|uniref:gas vesicle protein n=1 Tax=Streptomyces sichuanensis TaxID=2871810 RepID=UPI003556B91F